MKVGFFPNGRSRIRNHSSRTFDILGHEFRPPCRITVRTRITIPAQNPTSRRRGESIVLLIRTELGRIFVAGRTKTILRYAMIIVVSMDGVSGLVTRPLRYLSRRRRDGAILVSIDKAVGGGLILPLCRAMNQKSQPPRCA